MAYYAGYDDDYEISTATSRRAEADMRSSTKIDLLIKRAETLQKELEEALEAEAIFGADAEYPKDAVILFKRNFDKTFTYTYAAVKYASNSWAITGKGYSGLKVSFSDLVNDHLINALNETGEVWLATELTLITEL